MSMLPPSAECELVQQALDSFISNELDGAGVSKVRQHLGACRSCAVLFEERTQIKHLVRRAVRRETPDEGLRRRIQKIIRES
jgi:anti-sigma factor RsiW